MPSDEWIRFENNGDATLDINIPRLTPYTLVMSSRYYDPTQSPTVNWISQTNTFTVEVKCPAFTETQDDGQSVSYLYSKEDTMDGSTNTMKIKFEDDKIKDKF